MLHRIRAILISLSLVAATAGPVAAFPETEGVVMSVYLSIPLGGGAADDFAPSFGFAAEAPGAFGQDSWAPGERYRPARLADVQFTPQGLSALRFGGLDALDHDLLLNAAGGEEDGDGINWLYVLLGIGGAGLVALAALNGDDGGGGGCDGPFDFMCAVKGSIKKACKKAGGVLVNGICVVP